ncbi:MAG: 30S ribosomal protein S1 [Succinivibrionaceae bacterium]|jgi:small subunit ribosomal protein S1|nr:30S ribosomal protein S1 [Succinivibrionaceae bacterium]
MENFAQLFEESISKESNSNQVQSGRVVKITDKYVVVDLCTKSESFIDINEFKDANGNLEVKVGDDVQVELVANDNGYGETEASREKAKRQESWQKLEQDYNENKTVRGKINGRVKGGFTVEIDNIRAFLPGSLVDVRTNGNNQNIDGQEFDFKVIKLDQKRNNVVVSRKAVLENENSSERKEFLASIEEGKVIEGTVKNLAEYGAFVDLGFNVDGLLHITDMAWKRVKHPSEIVNVGDKIKVKVLKYEPESTRVSLGLKQLGEDPWQNIAERFPVGEKLKGKVTNLAEYGCFVEIADGVEGLVHVSEMDWTNKNVHPSKVVSVGDEVEVKVLEIIPEKRRISLGLKQCKPNPWQEFAEKHNKGDKVTGSIKSITDFGIFIGLEGGIDGLVHLSDISWSVPGDEAVRDYKKNDEVTAVVLQVHPELERISLGIKQLSNDPFGQFVTDTKKNSIVKGTVVSVDAKGAVVDLGNNVEGYIRASEISSERVDDATKVLSEGQEIEAKYVGSDRKNRQVSLSIKAVFEAEEKAVAENIKSENEKAKAETGNAMAEAFKAAKGE